MNVAVSQRLELPANSVTARVSFRTERGRLYTVIASVGAVGGTVRVRYTTDTGILRVDHTMQAPDPALFAVAADVAGTIEITHTYEAAAVARFVALVVAKEITV